MLTAVAVLTFAFSNAQIARFGIKVGANLHTLNGYIGSEDTSSKVGFQVGAFTEIKVSSKFSVQPEILFSTQGVEYGGGGYIFGTEGKWNLSYLNFPTMVKFYAAEKFSLEAGTQVGFLLSAGTKFQRTYELLESDSGNSDITDSFNRIDFGVNFGAGYDLTENFSVGLRYNLGLTNVIKKEYGYETKNSVFALNVAYKF